MAQPKQESELPIITVKKSDDASDARSQDCRDYLSSSTTAAAGITISMATAAPPQNT